MLFYKIYIRAHWLLFVCIFVLYSLFLFENFYLYHAFFLHCKGRYCKFILNVILLTAFFMYENHCYENLTLATYQIVCTYKFL